MSTNKCPQLAAAVLMLTIGASGHTQALVLYSTFGPGDSFKTTQGLTISGSNAISGVDADANQFSVATNARLGSIELGLFVFSPDSSVSIEFRADNAGSQELYLRVIPSTIFHLFPRRSLKWSRLFIQSFLPVTSIGLPSPP